MGNLIGTDNAYKEWLSDISLRFKQSQIKASMKVNSEMLRFYWSLGHDMDEKRTSIIGEAISTNRSAKI